MKYTRLALLVGIIINPAYSLEYKLDNSIPDGFENMSISKQKGYAEVKIGGTSIGLYEIYYDDKELKILNNESVFRKIKKIISFNENNEKIVLNELEQFKSIEGSDKEHVRYLLDYENMIVNIIIDDSMFLNINKREKEILNESTNKVFSGINNLRIHYNYNDDKDELLYNVSYYGKHSVGNNRLNYDAIFNDEKININNLNFEKEYEGNSYKFGYTNSFGNRIFIDKKIFGINIGTSLDTRTDLKDSYNKPIIVNLSEESIVSIFKGSELIYTKRLPVGVNEVVPKNMPKGGYMIRVVKKSMSGIENSYEEFYSKTETLPPENLSIWNFQIGNIVEENENTILNKISNETFASFSIFNRMTEKTSIRNEFQYYKKHFFYSPTINYYDENIKYSLSLGIKNINDYKIVSNLNLDYKEYGNFVLEQELSHLVNLKQDKINFSYHYNVYEYGNISLNYNYTNKSNFPKEQNYYINYNKNLLSGKYGNLNFNLSFGKISNENSFLVGLKYNLQNKNNNYGYYFNAGDYSKNTIYYQTNSENTTTSAQYDIMKNQKILSLNNNYNYKDIFNSNIYYMNNNSKDSIYGDLETSIVYNEDSLNITKKTEYNSGIKVYVVEEENNPKNSLYDVFVNYQYYKTIKSNENEYLSLKPYEEYVIEVFPSNKNMYSKIKSKTTKIILYPNNVQTLKWESQKYKIIFAKLIDKDNEAIRNKEIKTDIGTYFTDSDGFIQMEVDDSFDEKGFCTIEDEAEFKSNNILYYNELKCDYIF